MKKYLGIIGLAASMGLVAPSAFAESSPKLLVPHITMSKTQVIAGAKLFAERCMACHSLTFMRYSYLHADLGLSKAAIKKYILLPGKANYLGHMISPMPPKMAVKWFGRQPPNLSQMERYKGPDWIYTYLLSFYWDPQRPSGWDNHIFPNVAMPNIMAPWGGIVNIKGKVLVAGSESQQEFRQQMTNIVAFLKYVSDPSYYVRHRIGPWMIGILVFFTIIAYLVKREFWKDVK